MVNFYIDEKEYTASVNVSGPNVEFEYVFVSVGDVAWDVKDSMPFSAMVALRTLALKKYQDCGGIEWDLEQQKNSKYFKSFKE